MVNEDSNGPRALGQTSTCTALIVRQPSFLEKYTEACANIIDMLATDPRLAVQDFRAVFEGYRRCPVSPWELSGAKYRVNDLMGTLDVWSLGIAAVSTKLLDADDLEQRPHDAFTEPDGLLDLFHEIMLSAEILPMPSASKQYNL